jgi:hypothetical protein
VVTRPPRPPIGAPGRPASARPPRTNPARPGVEGRRPIPPPAPRGRVKIVERFGGRRVRHRTGVFRRVRSLLGIMIIGIVIAAIVAAVVAVIVGAIALAAQHALGN